MEINKTIQWLLENNNPPVQYLTLKNLLNLPESDQYLQNAKASLMDYEVTRGILEHSEEFWKDDDKAYWKYTGKYWQLIFLGQFLADGQDPRIIEGVTKILDKSGWIIKSGGQCLTANILSALMRLGYRDHQVLIEETERLAIRINSNGGIICTAMDYSLMSHCYMALPKLLLCFAEVPVEKRTPSVKKAIEIIVNILIKNEVFVYVSSHRKEWQAILEKQPKREDLPMGQTVKKWRQNQKDKFLKTTGFGKKDPKQGWLKFGFPLHYNSDILEAMYALALVNTPMDQKLQKPLQVIKDKMTPDGKWILENSLNGKMWIDVEEKGKPSKWLTYFAMYVLNHFEKM